MAKKKERPARQQLRGRAETLIVDADNTIFWSPDSVSGIFRHDWATQKTTELKTTSPPGPLALLGDGRLAGAAFDFAKQRDLAAIYDAASGETLHKLQFPKKRESVTAVAASSDGRHVAVATGHMNAPASSIEVFTAEGEHIQSIDLGKDGVTNTADALIFTTDSAAVRYLVNQKLYAHPLGEKEAHAVECRVPEQHNWNPRTSRHGDLLLLQFHAPGQWTEAFLVEEKTGKVTTKIEECEVVSFGRPDELVWQREKIVRILDLEGKTRAQIERKRKTRLEAAQTNALGWWCAGGPGSIEIYDLKSFS